MTETTIIPVGEPFHYSNMWNQISNKNNSERIQRILTKQSNMIIRCIITFKWKFLGKSLFFFFYNLSYTQTRSQEI